jgi:hypothetical protein
VLLVFPFQVFNNNSDLIFLHYFLVKGQILVFVHVIILLLLLELLLAIVFHISNLLVLFLNLLLNKFDVLLARLVFTLSIDAVLLFFFALLFLRNDFFSESLGFLLQVFLLLFLVNNPLFGVINLVTNVVYIIDLFDDIRLILNSCFFEFIIFILHSLDQIVLLLFLLVQLFILTYELPELLVLRQLTGLLLYSLQVVNVCFDVLNILSDVLFVLLDVVDLLMTFVHLIFQFFYLLLLVIGHPQGGSVVARLVKDLTDQFLTLLDKSLLVLVARLQHFVDFSVFLLKLFKVFAFEMVVQKLSELRLDGFVLLLVKAHGLDLLGLFLALVVRLHILLSVVK